MFRKAQTNSSVASTSAIVTSDARGKKNKFNLAAYTAKMPHLSRPALIGVGVALFVIIVPLLFFLYLQLSDRSNYVDTAVCSEARIKDASQQIDANNLTNLATISTDIKQLKHHELDPNCEYILVRAAMASGDTADARTQLALLKKDYQGAYSYSAAFTSRAFPPAELEVLINDLVQSQRQQTMNLQANEKTMNANDATADKLASGAKQ